MEKIIFLLNNTPGVAAWKVRTIEKRTQELYFVGKNLETNRSTDTMSQKVTVYIDKDGKRGASSFSMYDYMTEEELKQKIADCMYAASFAMNPYYDLPKPETFEDRRAAEDSAAQEYKDGSVVLDELSEAVFHADVFEHGSLNATEFFIHVDSERIRNSNGVDVSATSYQGDIELIPSWDEDGEEAEVYKMLHFRSSNPAEITRQVKEELQMAGDRFHARNLKEVLAEKDKTAAAYEKAAAEIPAAEIPAAEIPAAEIPAAEIPAAEISAVEIPAAEIPAVEIPAAEISAEDQLKNNPVRSLKVIVEDGEAAEILNYFCSDLTYRKAYEKSNLYELGDSVQGDQVTGTVLNMKLVPYYPEAFSSRPFDQDGTMLKETELIREGLAVGRWGSSRFGQYLGIEHPAGDVPVTVVKEGSKSFQEMQQEPYLRCVKFSGIQVEGHTGYFGGEVRLGYYFDGEKEIPVTGFSISGDMKEARGSMTFSSETVTLRSYHGPKYLEIHGMLIN